MSERSGIPASRAVQNEPGWTSPGERLDDEGLRNALREVNDPEFPISVVDMGLIQEIWREGERVHVNLTLTAMGCPAMEMILDDVRERLSREPNVREVRIEIVWDPPWAKDRMSEAGRARLRQMGIGT